MMQTLILKNVSNSYNKIKILHNISLTVNKGEIVSILGPSGCGKSTLLKIIMNLEKNYTGSILINNQANFKYKDKIAYMPQSNLLLPWRNLLNNIKLPLELEGLNTKEQLLIIKKDLHLYNLKGSEHKYPNELSIGMQQRAALFRTFLIKSNLMLLDEPFSALDAITQSKMQLLLIKLHKKYKNSILLITHNIEEALFLSNKIFILNGNPTSVVKEINLNFSEYNKDIIFSKEFIKQKEYIASLLN